MYGHKKKRIEHVNRMPRSRLPRFQKTTPEKEKGTQEDRWRD
jgi:hypothetical protein